MIILVDVCGADPDKDTLFPQNQIILNILLCGDIGQVNNAVFIHIPVDIRIGHDREGQPC
jgi:hypothetical protein